LRVVSLAAVLGRTPKSRPTSTGPQKAGKRDLGKNKASNDPTSMTVTAQKISIKKKSHNAPNDIRLLPMQPIQDVNQYAKT